MSFKNKIAAARTQIGAMGGFFAGMFASWIVDWSMWPKAALTMCVTVIVIPLLWAVLPKP